MKLKAKILTIVLALAMLFSIIGVFALPASAATPTKLYLKPNSNWTQANARFAAYFFGNGETWVDMTDSDGDGIYEVEVPSGYPSVIFCRMNPSTTANNWSNKWNQTGDLTIPTDGKNLFTIPSGDVWDGSTTTWSTLTYKTIYFDNSETKWTKVNCYAWNSSASNGWPGKAMTDEGNGIYSFTISSAVDNLIFNNGSIQTADITVSNTGCLWTPSSTSNKMSGSWLHDYAAATCTAPQTCTLCGATSGAVNASNHTGTEKAITNGSENVHSIYSCCGATYSTTHPDSDFGDWTKVDDTNHSRTCSCGYVQTASHDGGTATCIAKAQCTDCKQEYGTVNASNHAGTIVNGGTAEKHTKYDCCQAVASSEHDMSLWHIDGNYHYAKCACGYVSETGAEHTYTGWTDLENGQHTGTCTCGDTQTVAHYYDDNYDPDCNACGAVRQVGCQHTNKSTLIVEKPATCTSTGLAAHYYCTDCEAAYWDKQGNAVEYAELVLVKKSHSYTGSYVCVVDGKEGTHAQLCVNGCGLPNPTPSEHTWNTGVETTAPQCEVAGEMTYTCTAGSCGATYTESITALNHIDENTDHKCDRNCGKTDIGEHKDSATDKDHVCDYGCGATLEACSDVTGDGDHNCDVCNMADVTEHSYAPATCTAPQTCSECGATTGEKLDHDMTEATCKAPSTCKLGCGYTEGGLADHIYENGKCTVCKKVNTEDTVTIYFENNWQWPDASVYYWYFDGEENTKIDNAWPGTALTVEVGKNSEGYSIYQVKIPTAVAGVIFNGTGQYGKEQCSDITDFADCRCYYMTYDSITDTKPAGYYEYHFDSLTDDDHNCDGCGKEDLNDCTVTTWSPINETTHSGICTVCGETVVGDHSYTGDWRIGADNHWKDCDSCGYDGHAGEHNYAGEVQKDGTYHWQTCSCGDTNKVEHNYNKTVSTEAYKDAENPATCTKPASYYYSCECGAKGTSTFTSGDIADHVFVTHDAVEATCLTAGNKIYYTCENCTNYFTSNAELKAPGYSYENFLLSEYYIAALGHDMQPVAAQAPTCTAVGWEAYEKCSRCANSTYVEIPALNHKMDTTPFYRVDGGVLYQVTQCERYATCNHEVKTEASATVTVSNEADLRAVLAAGHNVKLANDITLTEGCIKLTNAGANIEIDMNEKTLTNNKVRVNDVVDVLWVANELKVTITGNGSMQALGTEAGKTTCVISATDGAIINIESGSFYSEGCTTIYATRGGKINISGGHYEAADSSFLIDINEGEANENYGTIVITGGQFVDFNPANHTNDKPVSTNKILDGYHAIESEGVYTVDEHHYVAGTPVPVTCTTDGYTLYTCKCGDDYKADTVSASGHSFGEVVPKVDATCTEKGNQAYKQCTRCNIYFLSEAGNYTEGGVLGSALNTFDIAASGHTFDEIGYDAPTCTEAGNEAHKKCTVCNLYFAESADKYATNGAENNDDYIINALGHKDENTDHVCDKNCGIPQGAHEDTDKDHACDYGCSVAIGDHVDANKDHACDYGCSKTIGEHKDSATDKDHVCDYCKDAEDILENCSDVTGDENHNCDVCGKENVSDHDWAGNTCTAPQTCNECGATSGEPKGHKFTTNITCDNGCGTKAAAKVGENYYITVAKALETAKTAAVKDLVITIVGENDASTADNFDLLYQSIFDSVILKQENGDKVYYFYDLYTGTRTNNGEFTFDGVNIVVTDQYMFEGNVRLANNSFIKSVTEANCFFYYSVTTVEPGSKLQGVIDDLRGGTVIVDGGRTDGEYNTTPDMQDAIIYIRWSGDSLTVKNGAYVKINSANEVGRLTVSAGTSLNVYDSKVDSYQWIENNGTINVDVNSLITTGKITGSGKIVIDAADYNDSIGQVIDADLSEFTGEIEVINCEGLFATVDGNGRLTFTKAVASIGSDYYLTLQDAFNAVENGETIVLARDFELSATAVAPAVKFTIDLNGKTVTSADDYAHDSYNQSIICVTRGTDLTINDSIGGGCLDASELLIAINLTRYGDSETGECAKLTVNAGKYLGGYYAIAGNGSRDNTYIEINDGQFIGDISAIYHPQEGTLVITGGSFVGNGAGGYGGDAIGFLSGSLEISGGTFEGKTLAAVSIENIGGTSGYQEIGTVSITGGTFISAEGYDSITSADEGGGRKISFISGGTFNTDLDLALLADGLALKQDGESYYVVDAVAKIDRTGYGYASLADAVAAAQANDEINLLANDTITKTLDISKSLTINTGAFDITSKADVAFNITASNVTFKLIGKVIVSDPDAVANARSGGVAVAQTVLTMDDVNDVIAILDAEFELGAGDVIYSGPVDNISLSVRDDYEAALNKKGYVTKDSTTPGMVDVTAKSLYYIGDDGYWYFDDVKTGVLAKGENGQSITITSYDKQPVKDGEFVVSHNYVITFSDGTEITINVPVARSIVSVEYDRTEGNKDIYVITYSDGSTSEFTVTNGTNGHSPVITIENGEWCIDGTPTGIKALGKDGKGIKSINKTTDGLVDTYTIIYTDDTEFEFTVTNGRGIVSISLTSTSADGLVDTYTITYNDGTTSTFTVTNGANGINGIQGEKGDDGHTPVITIQNGKWHIDGVDTGMQAQGVKGETGNGISDISKTGIDGLVDTYTITYTDGTTTTFTVTNGAQGAQGIQGIQGVPGKDGHTPVITIGENGNWFIDGADTGVKAEAIKGETGAPGADGEDGDTPYIGENGNWWIDGVDTGVKAEGKDGNDNNKIIIICIGIAALCIITTIVAVATKKFRRPWWILC